MTAPNNVVLITGINSFTGYYVSSLLDSLGYIVHGTTNSNSFDGIFTHFLDIKDIDNLNHVIRKIKPNYVIHLAAVTFVAHEDINDIYLTNLLGTRNLLLSLSSNCDCFTDVKKILLASSANIYGNSNSTHGLSENSPAAPINDYAVSKLSMEMLAKLWSDKLPITIVRPFNYTGVGQSLKFLIPKLINAFCQKLSTIELGNIDIYRDFTDVRDVASAYVKLMLSSENHVVNICSGSTHSLREIIAIISNISHHSIDITVNPSFIRKDDVLFLKGDPNKLVSIYPDWNPRPLSDTIEWMYTNQINKSINNV